MLVVVPEGWVVGGKMDDVPLVWEDGLAKMEGVLGACELLENMGLTVDGA